jgi:hypothetical protein
MQFSATPVNSQTSRAARIDPGVALNMELLPSLPAVARDYRFGGFASSENGGGFSNG